MGNSAVGWLGEMLEGIPVVGNILQGVDDLAYKTGGFTGLSGEWSLPHLLGLSGDKPFGMEKDQWKDLTHTIGLIAATYGIGAAAGGGGAAAGEAGGVSAGMGGAGEAGSGLYAGMGGAGEAGAIGGATYGDAFAGAYGSLSAGELAAMSAEEAAMASQGVGAGEGAGFFSSGGMPYADSA